MSPVRTRPLSRGPAAGRLVVAHHTVSRTVELLGQSAGPDGRHEGIVLWAGRTVGDDRTVVCPIEVPADTGWGHVQVSARTVGDVGRTIRKYGLALVAQVHSHPGDDIRHSDGDDDLIVMMHEGMWSLVVPRYGRGGLQRSSLGVHQRQNGQWVAVTNPSETFVVVPDLIRVPTDV